MKKLQSLWILILIGLLAGCAGHTPEEPFSAVDLAGKLGQGYKQKVDNAVIILDASSSMFENYNGKQKCVRAKNVILHMNETLPPLSMQTGLHVFGPAPESNANDSTLVYGMSAYNEDELEDAVKKVQVGGLTPLAKPLQQSIDTLKDSTGQIAVIVVSDGKNNSKMSPVEAAENLKAAYGDRICIYSILIGNDPVGAKIMEDIVHAGQCGFATTEAAVSSPSGMADFVERVFLEKAAMQPKPMVKKVVPPAPAPAPPAPAQYETITMNLNVQFDFDKDAVRHNEEDKLDEFAAFMKKHPNTTAVLEGHTDNYGTEKYNMDLSRRRAESVKKYMINKFNIAPSRLTTKGYGYSRPISTNKTEQGRQENRRVVAVISTNVRK